MVITRHRALRGLLSLVVIVAPGCSIEKMAVRSLDGVLDNTMASVMEEEDLKLAEQAIAGDLKLLDGLSRTDPENGKLLLLACQGYTSYALAFAEDSLDRARRLYRRAQQYGVRGLVLKGIPDTVWRSSETAVLKALEGLSKEDVPLVFWTVNAWGSAANLERDNPESIADLPLVNTMMGWVRDQDSTFFYGGPLLYFGTYYGSLPALLGGNVELSKQYFDRAVAASDGRFLMTLVFYAKTYAVQTQNEALFTDLLTRVVNTPVSVLPEQRLANVVAQQRARQLLARTAELF